MPKSTIKMVKRSTPTPDVPDAELYERAIVSVTHRHGASNYYNRHWMPKLKGSSSKVIAAMLKRCSFNPRNFDKNDTCWPSIETIAADAGVSVRTVSNVLARDEDGHFTYTYFGEAIGPIIERFVNQIESRWRYSQRDNHMMKSSNIYTLAVIMPPAPEDEEAVQVEFQRLISERDTSARQASASPIEKDCHYTDRQKLPSYCSAKVAEEDRPEAQLLKTNEVSITPLRSELGKGSTNTLAYASADEHEQIEPESPATTPGNDRVESQKIDINTVGDTHVARRSVGQVSESAAAARPALTPEQQDARQDAKFLAATTLQQYGCGVAERPIPAGASREETQAVMALRQKMIDNIAEGVIRSMEAAGAPYESMIETMRHVKARLARMAGIRDYAKVFSTAIKNDVKTLQAHKWDVSKAYAKERGKWEAEAAAARDRQVVIQTRQTSQSGRDLFPAAPPRRSSNVAQVVGNASYGQGQSGGTRYRQG